jgi:hypothetical protein
MSTHTQNRSSSRWLTAGMLALAALGAGCDKRANEPPLPSTTTSSGTATAPVPPASAASR